MFMTQRAAGLKFDKWWLGLGQDMPYSNKILHKGPGRAWTNTLGSFQVCQCICFYFLWIYKNCFMTGRVTGLKLHTWWFGLGRDMPDCKKLVCEVPCRALTDMLGFFQGFQCIYIYFMDLQKLFHDWKSPRTEVPHMVAPLGLGHPRFQKVRTRRSS